MSIENDRFNLTLRHTNLGNKIVHRNSQHLTEHFLFLFCQEMALTMSVSSRRRVPPRQLSRSRTTPQQGVPTAVDCVGETVTSSPRCKYTWESTQEKSLISAIYAGSSLPRKGSSKATKKSTLERNHFLVPTVGRASHIRGLWTGTVWHTQERGLTSALPVTGVSTSPAAWGNTRKLTLGRSLTVLNVGRASREHRASRTIGGFTRGRGHIVVSYVAGALLAPKAWGSTRGSTSRFNPGRRSL